MASDFSQNHFELFGLPEGFALDTELLAERYRELQQRLHPDRFATATDGERRLALQRAAQVNEAYGTLKDPLSRARYLLGLRGVRWDDEQDTMMAPEFLMEQMERREALEEARGSEDPLDAVGRVLDSVVASIREELAALEDALAEEADLDSAREAVRRLQFLYRLRSDAEELEADLEDRL